MVKKENCITWIQISWLQIHGFVVYIKTDDIYKDIAEDVVTRFDSSNYELERSLAKGKYKKIIGVVKDKLGGKILTKFVGLRAKTYKKNCLEATRIENKINYLEKNKIDIYNIKEFIKNNKSILKIQQRFKSEKHNASTEEIN